VRLAFISGSKWVYLLLVFVGSIGQRIIVCFIGGNEWKKKKALATPCKGFTKNVTKDILPNSIIYMMALAMNIVVKLNLLQRYN
jgi:hypothetical protein